MRGPAFFAYADNYLVDVRPATVVDVEASRAVRQAEVGAARTMIDRTADRFGLRPERLAGDTAYGSAQMLNWLVEERNIAPPYSGDRQVDAPRRHVRAKDFRYDQEADAYIWPAGKVLSTSGTQLDHRRRGLAEMVTAVAHRPYYRRSAVETWKHRSDQYIALTAYDGASQLLRV